MASFADKLLTWFDDKGRHDLPWQQDKDPYRVWVSEIMLQQTQVKTVIPYYRKFMETFPDIFHLADADEDQVLHLWTGLGYYSRARNLHKTACLIVAQHQGKLPQTLAELILLPGIGRSTAGAILAISMNVQATILDGNVKRVLARYHQLEGWTGKADILKSYWEVAERHTPNIRFADYTQAIMDLGATVCTRTKPACDQCPMKEDCQAHGNHTVEQYPQTKPRKILPVRSTNMLLFELPTGEIYLEKRPNQGVWGGLYSFPESETQESMISLLERFGASIEPKDREELAPFRHTFSHFHLDIQPIRVKLPITPSEISENKGAIWYNPSHSIAIGLATPVKKLLDGIRGQA
jgi:A/G-specific adenine glycosylase